MSGGMMPCGGTSTSRNVPTSGTITPMSSTIQMTDPNVIPRSRNCREAGTRPNRRVDAQPRVVIRIFPANLEPKAISAARNAIRPRWPTRSYGESLAGPQAVAAPWRQSRTTA